MIKIKKSETADTRTCDWSKVTKEKLKESSIQHIHDVYKGLRFLQSKLEIAAMSHDWDKIEGIDHFHSDFKTGFKETGWWDNHRKVNRHHLDKEDGIPEDVNLIDVLEHITDCVMAGIARSGTVYDLNISSDILQKAFKNTVELLKANVERESSGQTES